MQKKEPNPKLKLFSVFEVLEIIFLSRKMEFFCCLLFLIQVLLFRVSIKDSSVAKLGSVCRRVYRIFSHAYFHHRSIYDEFEVTVVHYNEEC